MDYSPEPRHRRGRLAGAVLLTAVLCLSCAHREMLMVTEVSGQRIQIGPAGQAPSAAIERALAPYRDSLAVQMSEVLAVCPEPMRRGRPEGLLGALVADIMLVRAQQVVGSTVEAAVTNNGGLRASWPAGGITLGQVFETMPFDNEIVLLRLSGGRLGELADQIAAAWGEPVAGLAFAIHEERAEDLRIAGREVAERDYWIATNDYLAGGGGRLPALWDPLEMRRTGILIRSAIADALRAWGGVDGRGRIPRPAMGRLRAR